MDPQTREGLDQRILDLEVSIGNPQDVNLVKLVANLQAKVHQLYQRNPELVSLEQISREVGTAKRNVAQSESTLSNAEKQEVILVKYPEIMAAYQNLVELLSLEMPVFLGEQFKKLDTQPLIDQKTRLELLADQFHVLVVKNLVVLEKFIALTEEDTRFWNGVEKRLNALGAQAGALEQQAKLESKY